MKDNFTFQEYSDNAWQTAVYPNRGDRVFTGIAYCVLGLSGETGEISEKIKKVYRDKQGHFDSEAIDLLKKEVGDVLWYLNALSRELGFSLADVARQNNQKLLDRMNRGVIQGSGDNR